MNLNDIPECEKPESPTTFLLRKNILTALHETYPQVSKWADYGITTAWVIDIQDFKTGGTITIRNLWISGKMGVRIKMRHSHTEILRQVVYYAGELLERYNIQREKGLDMREELLHIPRNFTGSAIPQ